MVEVHYDTYFFNVTNPDDVLNGAKPHVECKGLYAHDEYFQKFDFSWDDNEEEVTYNTYKYYLYNPILAQASPMKMSSL